MSPHHQHSKLDSIYSALENYQYNKAIKLCLQQLQSCTSSSSQASPSQQQHYHQVVLVRALLAHAYVRSGQRYAALQTIASILLPSSDDNASPSVGFLELQLEIHYVKQQQDGQSLQQQQASVDESTTNTTPRKGSKKGKKQQQSRQASTSSTSSTPPEPTDAVDWIDLLDQPPSLLPDTTSATRSPDWEALPPVSAVPLDETIIVTLASTIRSHLKLPLTVYQLYCWAAAAAAATTTSPSAQQQHAQQLQRIFLEQAYLSGLAVLVSPRYQRRETDTTILSSVLANMQAMALSLSRLASAGPEVRTRAIGWAAQAALWQLKYSLTTTTMVGSGNDANAKQQQMRLQMLPRLAESLAKKCVDQYDVSPASNSLVRTESFLLYLRTLDVQENWEAKLAAIDARLEMACISASDDSAKELVYPPKTTLFEMKADVLQQLGRYTEMRTLLEEQLLMTYPDNWDFWKRHVHVCTRGGEEMNSGLAETELFASKVLERIERSDDDAKQKYPLRGPLLIRVEIAAERLRNRLPVEGDSSPALELLASIIDYCDRLSSRASCIFSDVRPYMELELHHLETLNDEETKKLQTTLVEWLRAKVDAKPSSSDATERRRELRSFIFAIQMAFLVVKQRLELRDELLPKWSSLLSVWKSFQEFDRAADQSQKENRPADELVILSVQSLLFEKLKSTAELQTAASILEAGIRYSPYNAHIKMLAILVYSRLHSAARAWELFQKMSIKHIQYESCAFIILPVLRSGGMYQETITICKEIIRLQRIAIHDAGEYSGTAMESGALSKAEEFIRFHRERINKSLSATEAKGLVLDSAPLFVQDGNQGAVGVVHGIVGGSTDFDRAKQIIAEAHDPFAAFSLLRLSGSVDENGKKLVDNRDLSILSNDLLLRWNFDAPKVTVRDSLRRGHIHTLLIKAALCVESTKGPKKGKVVSAGTTLSRRCSSLLASVKSTATDSTEWNSPPGYAEFLKVILNECRVVAVIGGGEQLGPERKPDNLETREESALDLMLQICNDLRTAKEALKTLNEQELVQLVSRILPECIIPVFAVFQMCAGILDLFGWGRRKRSTKRCAGALADIALALAGIIDDMLSSLNCLVDCLSETNPNRDSLVGQLIEEEIYVTTMATIARSQQTMKDRISTVLLELKQTLGTFEV